MQTIQVLWDNVRQIVSVIKFPNDIIDILIVTFLIYELLHLTRSRTAGQVIKVIIVLLVLSYLSQVFSLNSLNFIISKVIEVGLIALVVVFQPELRRTMERLGRTTARGILVPRKKSGMSILTVEQTVEACSAMSRQKIGALIVFERQAALDEYFKTGTMIDASVSAELLKNIFFPNAALHDGAVVIRKDRIAAAGCVLPLTENPNLSRELGTRHRAAIGITEHSDAIVVVVSEETGVISCANGRDFLRYLTPERLTDILLDEVVQEEVQPLSRRLLNALKRSDRKKEDSHEEK